ncbi:restriction endonuclease subunit S [Pseudoalteromonas haloplanktis]|uniref:Restriction endonuclease subunit S n=1 Tax=Pseudoalteromonas haloplanktis TaxID=228 RepID=A0ABU1B813_PSEHA|nr:restriction endonuclease subunit S [Pseudoalteromonas haloplanktis]MDQ9090505.1 restriction endonuclease subunit S [Pseudoalteromonas haloplanktis]
MSWPVVKLSDVAELINGDRSSNYPSGEEIVEEGILFLSTKNIVENKIDLSQKNFITKEKFNSLGRGKLLKNDLIITLRGTLGSCCIFNTEFDTGFINAQMMIIRCKDEVFNRYLHYYLTSLRVNCEFQRANTGSAVPQLTGRQLAELEIPLPLLDEQKRIAAILDKADAIRRKRQQAIQLADDFLRSVFLDIFGDPVTNPKGFKKAAITELSDVITGYAFKSAEYVQDSENSVRLCRGANTLTGYFEWKDTAYWDRGKLKGIENYIINSGDVILAMDRPWISSGLKVCIFPENQRTTYLVQRVARIRPKQTIYTDYLYSCILSSAFEKHCCPTETTVPHISPVELKNFEVLVPDKKLVQKYHDVVFKVRSSMLAMEKSLLEANSAFNSLSQKAFAGEI